MEFDRRRERLVEQLRDRGVVEDDATAEALQAVPRHEFVPEERRGDAYRDQPLPIGEGQTVSAPHMVAVMIERLGLEHGDRVLEIGTGCGYHAAVTAEVVGEGNVFSVEYVPELADRARETLDRLGYDISIRTGDGHEGWPEHAPYDAAYLTCAAEQVPSAVVEQVRPGGRVLAPIGGARQQLLRLTVREAGRTERETFGGVRFVRMQGG
ncbi:protein-L-isoaspartate(D-aspartate) O-methyltransferase [Halolamina sp. CBA1230]|uniref:protein-L-isoaspartate(D-aspartate) O-methyltransferase n=1 Tax=Halolamina sp. CBA1230 TaxID=1853690 RepID=UPI0009A1F0F5|nr:protein-L-isoaspartate(D-aspartate) O-methyltransferase [Halolamina sp. CBA1230]QKY21313.1 protein-L-isoaspartate(D-aspartate) O-methyltransferase [Halolamina sp. CBA1230]